MKISQYPQTEAVQDSDIFLISRQSGNSWMSLRASIGAILARLGIGTDGKYKKESLPADIIYSGGLASALDNQQAKIFSMTVTSMWNAVVQSATVWPETEYSRKDQPMRANGHYPDTNPASPFYVCGQWLNAPETAKVLLDRYTPYMGGVQCSAKVNMPLFVKTSDSSLSLDYACCNDANPRAIVLGSGGWSDSVRPASMKRAFDNCMNLQAVIGEINMSMIPNAWAANSLFNSCPNLWQFHLANIPDTIETLDLSGVSINSLVAFTYSSGKPAISSMKYLAENFKRDITRTNQLTVIVSAAAFNEISGNPLYSKSGLTWASA